MKKCVYLMAPTAHRAAEWGFKILGAFVGTDEVVINALRQKSKTLKDLTDVMLRNLQVQARSHLHKRCCNAKVNLLVKIAISNSH